MNTRRLSSLIAVSSLSPLICHAQTNATPILPTVEVATKPGSEWKAYPTRTLAELPAAATAKVDDGFSRYGGRLDSRAKATGFFYPTKVNGRWWLVDPDGYLFINKGVVSVAPQPLGGDVLKAKYGDEAGWAKSTNALLQTNGFNSTGAWSNNALLQGQPVKPVYTPIFNFMGSYGKKRGGTTQLAGHLGYPKDTIFVFDPQFETFCDEFAKQVVATKNDPYLLGYFSDNEMPFRRAALRSYLSLPVTDPGFLAAQKWLRAKHGENATEADITPQDETDFTVVIVERYCRLVATSLKKYDPNHLYLGPRFHGSDLNRPEVFRAAAPYIDVFGINYYGAWTPDAKKMASWESQTKKPFIITEWYAKGVDSGMANTGGAGWLVKTQADRGKFYQNFTLGLLESKACVGWHWFKYADNDPNNKTADPSNLDSNKGIVTARYEPYPPLIDAMRSLNTRAYALTDYFDTPKP